MLPNASKVEYTPLFLPTLSVLQSNKEGESLSANVYSTNSRRQPSKHVSDNNQITQR